MMTIPEFDAFVESMAEGKNFELFDGTPLLMSNPSETREQIASNIGANLKLAMDKRGCRTYQGGMMVQASANSTGRDKFRPDVVVRCGPPSNNTFITDPIVVVEVLPPSTIERDRGPKLEFYKNLPTVQHVVLAYSDQMRVEFYYRVENGWEMRVLPTRKAFSILMQWSSVWTWRPSTSTSLLTKPPGLGRGQGALARTSDEMAAMTLSLLRSSRSFVVRISL
jgi:Uma2 family endonuclease